MTGAPDRPTVDLGIAGIGPATVLGEPRHPARYSATHDGEQIEIRLFGDLDGDRRRQIESLATLPRQPNLERPLRYGTRRDGVLYAEYPVPPRLTLADVLSDGPLEWADAAAVIEQLATALAVLHDHGVVHGALTPHAVRVRASGAVLCDVGLWAASVDDLTSVRSVSTALLYAAPELLDGALPTRSTDLYALAAVAHHLVMGAAPYAVATPCRPLELIGRMVRGPVPVPKAAGMPAVAADAITSCLALDSGSRLADAMALVEAVSGARFLRTVPPPAPQPDAETDTESDSEPPPSDIEATHGEGDVAEARPTRSGAEGFPAVTEHDMDDVNCDADVIGSVPYAVAQRLQADGTMTVTGSDLSIWINSPGGYEVQQISVPELQVVAHQFNEAVDAAVSFPTGCLVFTARWLEFITDQGNKTWRVPRERRRPGEIAVVGDAVWALQLSRRRVGRNTASRVQLVTDLRNGYRSDSVADRLHTVAGRLFAEDGTRLVELDPVRAELLRTVISSGWERGPVLGFGPRAAWSPQVLPRQARRVGLQRVLLDGSGASRWCEPMVSVVADSQAPQALAIAPDPNGCFFRSGRQLFWASNTEAEMRRVVGIGDAPFADAFTRLVASPRGALMLSRDGLLHRLVPPASDEAET